MQKVCTKIAWYFLKTCKIIAQDLHQPPWYKNNFQKLFYPYGLKPILLSFQKHILALNRVRLISIGPDLWILDQTFPHLSKLNQRCPDWIKHASVWVVFSWFNQTFLSWKKFLNYAQSCSNWIKLVYTCPIWIKCVQIGLSMPKSCLLLI